MRKEFGDEEAGDGVGDAGDERSKCVELSVRSELKSKEKPIWSGNTFVTRVLCAMVLSHCSRCRVLLVPGSWISSFESAARTSPAPFSASASGCNFLSQFQPRLKKIASDGALDQREERDDGTTTPIPFPEPIDAAGSRRRFCNKTSRKGACSINSPTLTAS